jgi:hypothetical protein
MLLDGLIREIGLVNRRVEWGHPKDRFFEIKLVCPHLNHFPQPLWCYFWCCHVVALPCHVVMFTTSP